MPLRIARAYVVVLDSVVLPCFVQIIFGPLDYEILLDEMIKASSILKPGKSPGYDNITNEMISISLSMYPLIFLSLFNRILNEGGALRHGPCLF